MKRIATVVIAVTSLTVGSIAAAAGDYSCPPGAKFCPPPGGSEMSQSYDDAFGAYQAQDFQSADFTAAANQSHHENQLNDGETLIMVAPGGGSPGMLTAGSVFKGPPSDYDSAGANYDYASAMNQSPMGQAGPAGGMIDYASDPTYNFMPPNSHSGPVSAMRAPAGAYNDNIQDNQDSGGGFMPPPPGFVPPPPGERSRSAAASDRAGSSGLAAGKAQAPATPARSLASAIETRPQESPAPTMSNQQPPYHEAYGETARKQPAVSSIPAAAPARSSASQAKPSRPAAASEDVPSAGAPKKTKKADLLFSEVANNTSKKNRKDNGETVAGKRGASEPARIPWWKGGMFRNKKNRAAAEDAKPAGKPKQKKSDKGGR